MVAARDVTLCEQVAAEIRRTGVRAEAIPTDVAIESDVANLISETLDRLGRLDVLVNNAGVGGGGVVVDTTPEEFDRVVATNLRGTFLCSREAFRVMMSRGGGRIINVSSLCGKDAWAGTGPYSASKWGILGLAKAMAAEGEPYDIKVTTLCPGAVASALVDDAEALAASEMISPFDVADAAVYAATIGPNVVVHEIVIERTGAE